MNKRLAHPGHYQAPRWLSGAHAQTIWPLAIKGRQPQLKRRRWETPDGDFIDIDRLPTQAGQPMVVLFHGLEGSSRSHYARALMRAVEKRGWNGMVVHFRGCSGTPNLKPRAYHSGDAEEIDWVLRRVVRKYKGVPIYATGVSLGGNALLCWLASNTQAHKLVTKAAAVSAPVDLAAAGHTLAQGFNKVYTRHFLRSMQRRASEKARAFPGSFDLERALEAKTLFDFDDAFTAPLHGFSDADDYWRRASSKPLLRHISVPTLMLNAQDDPFLPADALPKRSEVSPMVTLEQPEQGGHVGFVTGAFPGKLDWLPQRLLCFFDGVELETGDKPSQARRTALPPEADQELSA